MTNEEMDALDRWLAERLMGWKLCFETKEGHYCIPNDDSSICQVISSIKDWSPTRNIAQVGAIVGEMRKKGWKWSVLTVSDEDMDKPVNLSGFYKGNLYIVKKASTIQLSTCLAAKVVLRG